MIVCCTIIYSYFNPVTIWMLYQIKYFQNHLNKDRQKGGRLKSIRDDKLQLNGDILFIQNTMLR